MNNDDLKIQSSRQASSPNQHTPIDSTESPSETEGVVVASTWTNPEPAVINTAHPQAASTWYTALVLGLGLLFGGAVLMLLLSLG